MKEVGTAEAQLVVQAGQISSKVSTTTYNSGIGGLDSRLDAAESSITQNSNQIATKISTTTYESGMSVKENSIAKSSSSPSSPYTGQLWINTSVTPNVLYRFSGSSWIKVTPTTAGGGGGGLYCQ